MGKPTIARLIIKMAAVTSYSTIRSNLVYLVKNLSVDQLRPIMMEMNLITHGEHDKLADCGLSRQEKAEKLLISILPHKGKPGLEVFIKCLVWSGQLEVSRKLSVPEDVIERYLSENPHKLELVEVPCGPRMSNNCPQVGGPVFVLYASEHEGDRCETVNKFVQYLSSLHVKCVCDLHESRAVHIQDWSAWVAEKMRSCCESHGHVLVVSSVTLARSLQSGVSQDVPMRRGKFNSLAIANLLVQDDIIRRSIPVFLHSSNMSDCVPACLQGKTSFVVNIHQFHTQLAGNTSPEKVRQLAQLPCFKDLYDLSTFLVGPPRGHSVAAGSVPEPAVSSDCLTDSELRIVAEGIAKDWRVLAEKLSVDETVLRTVVREHPNHEVEQAYRMLLAWRDGREGTTGQSLSSIRHELKGSLLRSHWGQLAEQL